MCVNCMLENKIKWTFFTYILYNFYIFQLLKNSNYSELFIFMFNILCPLEKNLIISCGIKYV